MSQRRHPGRRQNVREHRRCRRLRAGHVLEDWRAGQGVPCRDRTRRIHRPPNHEGHEMRINFNSKDGVFAIKAENEEEKTQLKTSAVAICNLIIDFFDGEVQEMKAAKE